MKMYVIKRTIITFSHTATVLNSYKKYKIIKRFMHTGEEEKTQYYNNEYSIIQHQYNDTKICTPQQIQYITELENFVSDAMKDNRDFSSIFFDIQEKYGYIMHPDSFVNIVHNLYCTEDVTAEKIQKLDNIGFFTEGNENNIEIYENYILRLLEVSSSSENSHDESLSNPESEEMDNTSEAPEQNDVADNTTNPTSSSNNTTSDSITRRSDNGSSSDIFLDNTSNQSYNESKSDNTTASSDTASNSSLSEDTSYYKIQVPDQEDAKDNSGGYSTSVFSDENSALFNNGNNNEILILTLLSFVAINSIAWYVRTYHKDTPVNPISENEDTLHNVYENTININQIVVSVFVALIPPILYLLYNFRYYYFYRFKHFFNK